MSDDGIIAVGRLLRQLHKATEDFMPPHDAVWRPCTARQLGGSGIVYGHGDFTPWNLVSRNGLPFAVIDWENAGPVDALVELAQVCWLNVQLCDDDVAERAGLASGHQRAEMRFPKQDYLRQLLMKLPQHRYFYTRLRYTT